MARRKKKRKHQRPRHRLRRKVNVRELRQRFLIVCEGEKTEPNYFNSFRVPKAVVEVRGVGKNTIRLVEEAIDMMQKDDYDPPDPARNNPSTTVHLLVQELNRFAV